MKKVLIVGGTGTISRAVTERLSRDPEWEVYVLNRGNRSSVLPSSVHLIRADIREEEKTAEALKDHYFDAVCEFIAYNRADVERDVRLFSGKCGQYVFTSSASAYLKPAPGYLVSEKTPLGNPYWQYARDKIACEEYLLECLREKNFPVTIVRPSHTYDERKIPVGLHGKNGSWQVVRRIMEGKPVLVHGDGSSLWTLTFNRDFAVGYTGLLGKAETIGEAYQITGDESLSWNQIYGTIAEALGKELKPCHVSSGFLIAAGKKASFDLEGTLLGDKAVTVVFDNRKLKKLVPEMKTTVPFKEGVRIALDYILSHPEECQKEDPDFDLFCDRIARIQAAALREF